MKLLFGKFVLSSPYKLSLPQLVYPRLHLVDELSHNDLRKQIRRKSFHRLSSNDALVDTTKIVMQVASSFAPVWQQVRMERSKYNSMKEGRRTTQGDKGFQDYRSSEIRGERWKFTIWL